MNGDATRRQLLGSDLAGWRMAAPGGSGTASGGAAGGSRRKGARGA